MGGAVVGGHGGRDLLGGRVNVLDEGDLADDVLRELDQRGAHPGGGEHAGGKDEEHGRDEAQPKDVEPKQVGVHGGEEIVEKLQKPPGQVRGDHSREKNGAGRGSLKGGWVLEK